MESQLDDLSLHQEEEDGFVFDDGSLGNQNSLFDFCAIGRFLTDRSLNFNAMKGMITSIWRPAKGICIKELDHNRY